MYWQAPCDAGVKDSFGVVCEKIFIDKDAEKEFQSNNPHSG